MRSYHPAKIPKIWIFYCAQWKNSNFQNFCLGQKSENLVRFLVQMRTRKFAFEINWPLTVRWPTFSIQLYLVQEYLLTRWWLWIRKRNLDHSLFIILRGGHTEIWQRWLCQSWQHSPYSLALMVPFRSSNLRHAFSSYRPNLNHEVYEIPV